MCRATTCRSCGKTTWAGCGRHVDQVMAHVPRSKQCTCPREADARPGLFAKLRRIVGR